MKASGEPKAGETAGFEGSLKRLEEVVGQLERADLSLEESVKLFEEGMALVEVCRKQLDAAEGKVEMLIRRAGAVTTEPFAPPAGAKGEGG